VGWMIGLGRVGGLGFRGRRSLHKGDCFDGGRDRDRTCDPYHVKVLALAAITLNLRRFLPFRPSAAHVLPAPICASPAPDERRRP
jgi:hypothetical protein